MSEPETPGARRGGRRGRRRRGRARLSLSPTRSPTAPSSEPRPSGRSRVGCARPPASSASPGVRDRVDVPARPDDVLVATRGVRLVAFRLWTPRPPEPSSLIVADLPAESGPSCGASSWSRRCPPTSGSHSPPGDDGWLYLVTLTGTTGARDELSSSLADLARRARALGDTPLYAGFGITTPEHARGAAELTDGVVVGSRAVQAADEGPAALRDYVRSLRDALDASAGRGRPGGSPRTEPPRGRALPGPSRPGRT